MSSAAQLVALCMLTMTLLLEVGCVSRRTYDRVKTGTLEQTQALEAAREDVRALDREIVDLQASNRREDAALSELRASIQREEAQLPMMRERAEDTFATLKTEVATSMNQSWDLARKIVDVRQETVSLQTKVAQHKEEIEQAKLSALVASSANGPPQATAIEPSPSTVPTNSSAASPPIEPTDSTPPSPPPVTPAVPSPSVEVDPPSTGDDSWIGMILSWLSKIWNWLFG